MSQDYLTEDKIDLRALIRKLLRSWMLFLVCLVLFLSLGFAFYYLTPPVYKAKSSMLIERPQKYYDPSRFILGAQPYNGFNIMEKFYFVNEEVKVKSRSVLEQTAVKLQLYVNYATPGLIMDQPISGKTPFLVKVDTANDALYRLPNYLQVTASPSNEKTVSIRAEGEHPETGESISFDKTIAYNEWVEMEGIQFKLSPTGTSWKSTGDEVLFSFSPMESLITDLMESVSIEKSSQDASIVDISLEGNNPEKLRTVLNELMAVRIKHHLKEKLYSIDKALVHIDTLLKTVGNDLSNSAFDIQKYKVDNDITSLELQSAALINEKGVLENRLVSVNIRKEYYQYLESFLESNNEILISPRAFGIEDPILAKITLDLVELLFQKKTMESTNNTDHPVYKQTLSKINVLKKDIYETISSFEESTNINLAQVNDRIDNVVSQSKKVPLDEQQLIAKTRIHKFNENRFRSLIEKKVSLEIEKATVQPDLKVVDKAYLTDDEPIFPDLKIILIAAVVLALIVPVIILLLRALLSSKVNLDRDFNLVIPEDRTLGTVHTSNIQSGEELMQYPWSDLSADMGLLSKRIKASLPHSDSQMGQIIAINSVRKKAGKTFIASMLGTTLPKDSERVLIVNADQRHYKKKKKGELGLTDWTPGEDLQNYVQTSVDGNVHHLPFGQLSAQVSKHGNWTDQIMQSLREQYNWIIIDCTAMKEGIFGQLMSEQSDLEVMVVNHHSTTEKDLQLLQKKFKTAEEGNTYFVLNNVPLRDDYKAGIGNKPLSLKDKIFKAF